MAPSTRRQFLAALFATAIAAPLIRLGWMKAPVAEDNGISIRLIRQYNDGVACTRIDVLYGFSTIRPGREYQRAYNRALSTQMETIAAAPRMTWPAMSCRIEG